MSDEIDRWMQELTLEEKASLLSGADFWHTVAVERLGIPAIMCSDGPHGMRAQIDEADQVDMLGAAFRRPASRRRRRSLSSWDLDLFHEVGAAIADEARQYHVSIVLGPGVNIKRSPLCGRNFEYLSEDPFLAGELGLAIVDGIQSRGVGTSVKHFAANNQEHDRLRVSAEIDERTLREIYLPAFERIVTAGTAVDGDVRLQQGQRDPRIRTPLAPHRGPARRMGFRRCRRDRLGRRPRPGRRRCRPDSTGRCHPISNAVRRPWSPP